MKKFTVLLFCSIVLCRQVEARLKKSPEQCRLFYGEPTKQDNSPMDKRWYQKDGYEIKIPASQ